jgi:hypothetical protein
MFCYYKKNNQKLPSVIDQLYTIEKIRIPKEKPKTAKMKI